MTNLPTILRTNAVPFRQIDTVFDNLFNDFFNTVSRTPFNTVNQKSNYPRVDIRENRESVTLDATVPGLSKDDVSIDYEDGHLKISADSKIVIVMTSFIVKFIARRFPDGSLLMKKSMR